jgi:hypothetical protein
MTNDVTPLESNDDGWEDAASDFNRDVVRGDLIKCSDGHWTVGKDNTPLKQDARLVATGTAAGWVKWAGNKPVEYRMRKRGEPMADRRELGDNDENGWEAGPDGKPRDPWQNTRFCYFVAPDTAQLFTYSTATWSGRGAVIGLGDQIVRMRTARPGAAPIVEFHTAPYQTKFGRKMKPVLKVTGWVCGDDGGGAPLAPTDGGPKPAPADGGPKLIEQRPQKAQKAVVTDDMLNDFVPF